MDLVRRWLREHQEPIVSVVSVRRGAAGFGIVMDDTAFVCGGAGHTCDAIPVGATMVQVGTKPVRNKADVIASIRSVPPNAEVQFTYRHTPSAAAQEEQFHHVVQALRAAGKPPQIWVKELNGASSILQRAVLLPLRPILHAHVCAVARADKVDCSRMIVRVTTIESEPPCPRDWH